VEFNHLSVLTVSLFIVVFVFVDVAKRCFFVCACAFACSNSESLTTCEKVL